MIAADKVSIKKPHIKAYSIKVLSDVRTSD